MTGVELCRTQLGMAFEIQTAGLHEAKRFGNAIRQFNVAPRLRTVFDKPQHPLADAAEVGIATLRECTKQIECRRRLPICLYLSAGISAARFLGECDVVDDIATVA